MKIKNQNCFVDFSNIIILFIVLTIVRRLIVDHNVVYYLENSL